MSSFRSRVRLHAPEGTSDATLDYNDVNYLPLLVRDEASSSITQLLAGTLEWRTDRELANLSPEEGNLDI